MVNHQNNQSHNQGASQPAKKSKNNNPTGKNQYTSGRAKSESSESEKKW